jgi:hypothetical protein
MRNGMLYFSCNPMALIILDKRSSTVSVAFHDTLDQHVARILKTITKSLTVRTSCEGHASRVATLQMSLVRKLSMLVNAAETYLLVRGWITIIQWPALGLDIEHHDPA